MTCQISWPALEGESKMRILVSLTKRPQRVLRRVVSIFFLPFHGLASTDGTRQPCSVWRSDWRCDCYDLPELDYCLVCVAKNKAETPHYKTCHSCLKMIPYRAGRCSPPLLHRGNGTRQTHCLYFDMLLMGPSVKLAVLLSVLLCPALRDKLKG